MQSESWLLRACIKRSFFKISDIIEIILRCGQIRLSDIQVVDLPAFFNCFVFKNRQFSDR